MKYLKILGIIGFLSFCLFMPGCSSKKDIKPENADKDGNSGRRNFVFWQLQSSSNSIGMSYIFKMNDGEIAVLDGGWPTTKNNDAGVLRAKLALLGNDVKAWFISHPHPDHAGALYSILGDQGALKIETIYHSRLTNNLISLEDGGSFCNGLYKRLDDTEKKGIQVVNMTEPGQVITIDKTHFKILSVRNPELTGPESPYNNSSMAIRVWDDERSIVFLGDLMLAGGEKLLNGTYKDDLDCDYLQMAHHGNHGVSFDLYRDLKFSYCLWPTPNYLWTNNNGAGSYNTVELRKLVDSMGVKANYVAWEGTVEIK